MAKRVTDINLKLLLLATSCHLSVANVIAQHRGDMTDFYKSLTIETSEYVDFVDDDSVRKCQKDICTSRFGRQYNCR